MWLTCGWSHGSPPVDRGGGINLDSMASLLIVFVMVTLVRFSAAYASGDLLGRHRLPPLDPCILRRLVVQSLRGHEEGGDGSRRFRVCLRTSAPREPLRLPIMGFIVDCSTDNPSSPAAHGPSSYFGLVLLSICGRCLQICGCLIETTAAHLALITTVFGTGLFHYRTYDACYSHIYSALGGTLLLWLGVLTVSGRRAHLPTVATILICFFLVLIRNTNVLLLAGLALAYLGGRKATATWQWPGICRDAFALFLGAGAGALLQLAYNRYAFGQWVLSSYHGERFVWQRPMQLAVLFSYERGLFTYYPIVAVTLLAGVLARCTRLWTTWFACLLLAYVVLYGFWECWTLGGSFGYRGIVDVLPAGAVVLAGGLAGLSGWQRTVISACAWLCMFVTLELMVGSWTWRLAGDTNLAGPYWRHVCGSKSILWFLYRDHPRPRVER